MKINLSSEEIIDIVLKHLKRNKDNCTVYINLQTIKPKAKTCYSGHTSNFLGMEIVDKVTY